MSRIPFYALGGDLASVLSAFESAGLVEYVLFGHHSRPDVQTFDSHRDLPDLGVATSSSAVGCARYLVVNRETGVIPREIKRHDGSVVFSVDQMLNPDSIVISMGGLWERRTLLSGEVATISDSLAAQSLMRRIRTPIRKQWEHIRAYWVGPEASRMLDTGARLTIAEQSPIDFDLHRP